MSLLSYCSVKGIMAEGFAVGESEARDLIVEGLREQGSQGVGEVKSSLVLV